jgi:WD40 repeat protein
LTRTIIIDNQKTELKSRDHLISILNTASTDNYHEIWLEGHGKNTLCILTNPDTAFLMYLRHVGDSGFRSNNKSGDESKTQEFKLSNGQIDLYPETWLTDKANIKSAMLTYFDTGTMDKSIDWIEEN